MVHNNYNHYVVMFWIMILSGLLSTMNIWVDNVDDIRFSLNDLYMTLLMTGWMFFFMGVWYMQKTIFLIGMGLTVASLWAIRTQFMVTTNQYILGMIPHHSMAIHMSKQLLEKESTSLEPFVKSIIETQEKEIQFMKKYVNSF
jgi:hypothetical protein